MNMMEARDNAGKQLAEFTRIKVEAAIGVSKTDKGWMMIFEVLERQSIPDTMDIIGKYEVETDNEGNIMSYERKSLRKRGDVEEKE